ncbi:MAG TPA: HIT family protein [Candidatus Merdenecus merdavium]|nr:HIT family protein [Candidatus Merdenecus merdavium]
MDKNTCIFCKIANGEIPSATLYEDSMFRVILDLSPASKGHALILPKKHFENLFDMPEEEGKEILLLAKKVGTKLKEVLSCDGMNLIQNNGSSAGQTVFHFHMHLIPRNEGDDIKLNWEPGVLSEEVKQLILEKFTKE